MSLFRSFLTDNLIEFLIKVVRYPRQRRLEYRKRNGLCYYCGYDVRDTHGVCPECGHGPIYRQNQTPDWPEIVVDEPARDEADPLDQD